MSDNSGDATIAMFVFALYVFSFIAGGIALGVLIKIGFEMPIETQAIANWLVFWK